MKISRIRSEILEMPQADPLANTPEDTSAARPIVILRVDTDDGIEGIGVTFYGGAITASLKRAVDDLGALTVGEDPLRIEAIIAKLRAAAGGSGPAGMFTLALSAIDIALWDIRGKALNQPLWKLLGGARQRVATYASGALRRNLSLDEVVAAAGRLKDKGFREMKTQLALPGDTSPAKEVERMRRVREAIGPDIKLMCDINQRWRVEQAIDIGRRVEDAGVGLFWLEDVTTHDDYAGLARVNAALATPICGGELVYGIVPFRHMIESRSVDYVMIDLIRVGGITQWLKVAGMAEAFNLPVVSHVIPEIHAHLVGGITVLQLAAAYPDRLAAIVMVDPAPFVFSPELRAAVETMVAAIEAGNQEPCRQFIRDHLFLPTSDRRLVEAVLEGMLAAPAHVAANAMRGRSSSTPVPRRHGARCRHFTWQQRHRSIRRI